MNLLKKGPEVKLSEIKVPGFVQDIYYDLKDRHLLPVAAVLLVALIAVPIALSQSGSEEEPGVSESGASASISSATGPTGELVSKATPGLRDYRRRLDYLQAKDPFHQQYEGESSSSVESTEATGASSEETVTESSSPESITTPSEPSGTETGGGNPGKENLHYYSYAIDVKVTALGATQQDSSKKGGEPTVRHNLPELTMLPSRKTPALVYMGSTKDGKKALMVVSSDVQSAFGDAGCVLGSTSCQILALETGLPETVVYGGGGKTYKIELLKIHLVETKDLNRAPLGEPKDSGSGSDGSSPKEHGQRLSIGEDAVIPGR